MSREIVATEGLTKNVKTAPEKAKLLCAIVRAKKEFKGYKKDTKGHNYQYASLPAIIDAVEDGLLDNDLVLVQAPFTQEDVIGMMTQLWHAETGEYLEYIFLPPKSFMSVNQKGIQAVGSIITYLKRYHLTAILNLAEEDDDGAAAMPSARQQQRAKQKSCGEHPKFADLNKKISDYSLEGMVKSKAGGYDWKGLPIAMFDKIEAYVDSLISDIQKKQQEMQRASN